MWTRADVRKRTDGNFHPKTSVMTTLPKSLFGDPPRGPPRRFSESPSRGPREKSPRPCEEGSQDPPETPFFGSPKLRIGVPLGRMLPRGAPVLHPFPGSFLQGDHGQREEELDKEFAERVCLHEEEAAAEFPLQLPPTPSARTCRPGLFNLLSYGLVDPDAFQRLQQVDEATFLNNLIHLINKEKVHELFYLAFGA
jgi:hypothetical protein